MLVVVAVASLLAVADPAPKPADNAVPGAGAADEPRKIAESYLKALAGTGSDDAKNYLLGGSTLTAADFTIPNWKIQSRVPPQIEEKPIVPAVKAMWELDKIGADALTTVVTKESGGDDGMGHLNLSQEQAEKLLLPTKIAADKFSKAYPVFSYVARVGKDVYWHPENPWRKEVKKLGKEGSYKLELHKFNIEESDGGKKRVWPLRVLRVTTKTYDSGWKILPASDWDPNY
jgi:hypothetical protein